MLVCVVGAVDISPFRVQKQEILHSVAVVQSAYGFGGTAFYYIYPILSCKDDF